ncbi:MAG: ABC transporter permease, partial [Defluviitoga tunisiensis]
MWSFITRRVLIMIPMMFLISVLCFIITELQPGSFASQFMENPNISPEHLVRLNEMLGLDKPPVQRYFMWIKGIVTKGDFGYSFAYKRPVGELIWERMGWTVSIALLTIIFQWIIAIPAGIYTSLHQYSVSDYILTFIGFLGISVPVFFLALVFMWLALQMGATSLGGLFSAEY